MNNVKKSQIITKSNYLIEASYRLSLQEQRLILFMASMVKVNDDNLNIYRVNIKDFYDIIGVKNNSLYKDAKNLTKKLLERTLIIKDTSLKKELQIGWISSAEYFENKGYIEIEFSKKLKPYLLELKSRFTQYHYKNILELKSNYSVRLYELLKQYEKIGERIFELQELRNILGIKDDEYPLYGNFKQRILNQAKKEISKETDISIDFKGKKDGRKVNRIIFYIKSNVSKNKKNSSKSDKKVSLKYIKNNDFENYIKNICEILNIDEAKSLLVLKEFYNDLLNSLENTKDNNTLKYNSEVYINKPLQGNIIKEKNKDLLETYLKEAEKKEELRLKKDKEKEIIQKNQTEDKLKKDFALYQKELFKEKYNKINDNERDKLEAEYFSYIQQPKKSFFLKKYTNPAINNKTNKHEFFIFHKEKILNSKELDFEKYKKEAEKAVNK